MVLEAAEESDHVFFSELKFNLHIPTKRVIGSPVYEIKINLYLKLLSRAVVTMN
jgi:hypothetical protein